MRLFGKRRPLDWRKLTLEATGSNDFGPCECCGKMSRTVWGLIRSADGPLASYFVQWTLGNPAHGANFDLIVGKWGETASNQDRQAVALEYRVVEGQGAFGVIDAASRPTASSHLVGAVLQRQQVIGQPIAQDVFAFVDAVLVKDERIQEIRSWS